MIDLVTNFKIIIDKSTKSTISVLEEVFNSVNIDKNKDFIRNITKYYMAMAMWTKDLKGIVSDNDRNVLLDNILLDYCSILNCVILADEKLINFLYRNIIESILRFITSEVSTKEVDRLFKLISADCTGIKEKSIIQSYVSVLKSIYDETCLYIHTDVSRIPLDIKNLMEYKKNSDELKMNKLSTVFDNLNIGILCIFQIKYNDVYLNFKSNTKGLIDEIIPLKNRLRYNEFIKEISSK